MVGKSIMIMCFMMCMTNAAVAQEPKKDSIIIDTSFTDYEELFNELELFLDSLTAPRSFTMINLGIVNSYLNYESENGYLLDPVRKLVYTPTVSYYSKTGLGISVTSAIVQDGNKLNPYQFYLSGSYDYLTQRQFITGISYTRFFTKDSLSFYTSPLKNELYAYFTYRDLWIRPTVVASYGWGSRSDYDKREEYVNSFLLRPSGYTTINTQESIADFNLTASLRHDFYWLNAFSNRDHIRVTPQVSFISGTQQFGFNQTSNSYATEDITGSNILYNSENVYLDNQLFFQPLSLSAYLKAEYAFGKFFIQPQFLAGYYFPAKKNNFSTSMMINAGVIF